MAKATGTDAHRDRILKAALNLLSKHGRDAVTTRSVAEFAKVQPPVLYRLFGNKDGLLNAVAAYGFAAYMAKKRLPAVDEDPVEALRAGWDVHVTFGLDNPELYLLMYAQARSEAQSQAAQRAHSMLSEHMQRVAASGRLHMSVERACALYHAAAVGVVLTLLSTSPAARDLSLSSVARDQALSGITTQTPVVSGSEVSTTSIALHALLLQKREALQGFSEAEGLLLLEWLRRLGNGIGL
jgi:AcrR family transcriptional regulator